MAIKISVALSLIPIIGTIGQLFISTPLIVGFYIWFLIFGYLILISLIGIVGIGILYTFPVFMCANYVVFHEVTKGEEIDDVIDHLVE